MMSQLERLRSKHPNCIPCIVHAPENRTLKMLVPMEANAAFLNGVCRTRLKDTIGPSEGLFLVHKSTLCSGTLRIATLDLDKPNAVEFHMAAENTFG